MSSVFHGAPTVGVRPQEFGSAQPHSGARVRVRRSLAWQDRGAATSAGARGSLSGTNVESSPHGHGTSHQQRDGVVADELDRDAVWDGERCGAQHGDGRSAVGLRLLDEGYSRQRHAAQAAVHHTELANETCRVRDVSLRDLARVYAVDPRLEVREGVADALLKPAIVVDMCDVDARHRGVLRTVVGRVHGGVAAASLERVKTEAASQHEHWHRHRYPNAKSLKHPRENARNRDFLKPDSGARNTRSKPPESQRDWA
jgi:hypothetical protein